MNKLFLLISFLISFPIFSQVNLEAEQAEAEAIVAKFGKELKTELVKAMEKGGALSAIDICNIEAPQIASEMSDSSVWNVRRTSLKFRNPDNKSDDYEKNVLVKFEERLKNGESISSLSSIEETEDGIRFMKAIETGSICLKCHGDNISEDIVKVINELYPNDHATGYKTGEIRGAFSLIKSK